MSEPFTAFISNINYKTTKEELVEPFKSFGPVIGARVLSYSYNGRMFSRGIGFVDFETEEALNKVLALTEPINFMDRKLFVRKANPKPKRVLDSAFLGGIAKGVTKEIVMAAFQKYKPVDCKVIKEDTPERRGFGFIKFESEVMCQSAIKELPTLTINGAQTEVKIARRPYDRKPIMRRKRNGPTRAPKAE